MKLTANGLTGQQLMDYLVSIDFQVPAKIPMPPKDYPAWIPQPKRTGNNDTDRANLVAYRDYMNERARLMQEYMDKKYAYNWQFIEMAAYLETTFDPQTTYTWLKISERLIGKYGKPISNPIHFIAFKEF